MTKRQGLHEFIESFGRKTVNGEPDPNSGFKVLDEEPGRGQSRILRIRDKSTDTEARIEVWPGMSRDEVVSLLTRAAAITRQTTTHHASQSDWMM